MKNSIKSSTLKRSLILLVFALCVYGCKKDNSSLISTKSTQVAFGLQATSASNFLAATTRALVTSSNRATVTAPVINFTSGTANISRFKLEAKKGNTNIEIQTRNLMNVDLFALNPAVITATLDTGTYKEIEVRVEFAQTADTAARPLTLKGSFTAADSTVVPVEFDINEDLTIKAGASNVVLHNNTDLSSIVMLHLDRAVAGITASDLNSAKRTNGVIVISSTSNVNLFNKLKLNVENCGDTDVKEDHHDGGHDGDGHDGGGNH